MPTETARVETRIRRLLPLGVIAAAFALLYGSVVVRLVHAWTIDENYSHGFLIVPISAYLLWKRRADLAQAPRRGSLAGLGLLVGSVGLLLFGLMSAEVFLSRISMLGVIAGAVLYVYGWRHLAIVAFPLGFLILMIPVPAMLFNQIALPLQFLASQLGAGMLGVAGVPVLREGNVIALAHTKLEVAEACSGIRSLVSLLALAIVYGYFADARAWMRVTLAVVAIPVAIAVNGLRIAGTGLLAQNFGVRAAEGFFHEFSGWLMFLAAFVLLVAVHRMLALAAAVGRRANHATGSRERSGAKRPAVAAQVESQIQPGGCSDAGG